MVRTTMHRLPSRRPLVLLLAVVLAAGATAQQPVYYKLSTGTGFIINNDGHIITNAHVVRGCRAISILTPAGEKGAVLVADDTRQDLAVLKSDYIPQAVAPLRWNIADLRVGDTVVVMGFPGTDGAQGRETYRKTQVKALKGPEDQPQWIQLGSVATHGNSGGPVLDSSGNVIAVITGMAKTYHADAHGNPVGPPVGEADIAITLTALQTFLLAHAINFYESSSGLVAYADGVLHDSARHYTVPVRCVQEPVPQP